MLPKLNEKYYRFHPYNKLNFQTKPTEPTSIDVDDFDETPLNRRIMNP